jgi:hypothetical protein
MGYTTEFMGQFKLSKQLTLNQYNELRKIISPTRHENFPSYYCHWDLNYEGLALEWDGGEKFYEYIWWLEYIIKEYLDPWGITLNGDVKYSGEDADDNGTISVVENIVSVFENESVKDLRTENERLKKRIAELEEELDE